MTDPWYYGRFPMAGRHAHSLATSPFESCAFKSAISGVMGAGLGVAWGLFAVSLGSSVNSYSQVPGSPGYVDPTTLSTREALKRTAKEMYTISRNSAKSFGFIGMVYTATECTIEKVTQPSSAHTHTYTLPHTYIRTAFTPLMHTMHPLIDDWESNRMHLCFAQSRGKADLSNALAAGCLTGAGLAARQGLHTQQLFLLQ